MSSAAAPSPVPARPFFIAVGISFLCLIAFAWIRGGVSSTAYDAVDSRGHTMGFNDVFSAEQYAIVLRNGSPIATLKEVGLYGCLLVAAQITALAFARHGQFRRLRTFLWLQPVIFFPGVPALYALPVEIGDLLFFHTNSRESFVDLPWVAIMSQGAWLYACLFMLWRLRRRPGRPARTALGPRPAAA